MKRIFCYLMVVILVMSIFGCATANRKFVDPIAFYYLNVQPIDRIHHGSVDSVIGPEVREGYLLKTDVTKTLQLYLAGPDTEFSISPFPSNTRLIDWAKEGTTLSVTLSDEISQLTGIDLVIACACLYRTCSQLWDYDTIQIQAESMLLDGKPFMIMNDDNLLFVDDTVQHQDPTA